MQTKHILPVCPLRTSTCREGNTQEKLPSWFVKMGMKLRPEPCERRETELHSNRSRDQMGIYRLRLDEGVCVRQVSLEEQNH